MKLLVVGGGAREHALCWKLAASPLCRKLFCAPGNAGIAEIAECVPIKMDDIEGITKFAAKENIDFVVVGPETPLVLGLVDRLAQENIRAFGPDAKAAALEGSKGFMKDLATRYNIPTARYIYTDDPFKALSFARSLKGPVVVKADGLAAGKGVIICENFQHAEETISNMLLEQQFGAASKEIVVEEFLAGEELSYFALSDGEHVLPLGSAQDHKQIGEGDTGPNTGGMGAYSPASKAEPETEEKILEQIIKPAIRGMKELGRPFKGVLFAGIMVTAQGPKLVEFNVRFGDPECEVLCLRLKSDLLPALIASSEGGLNHVDLRWHEGAAMAVVMAAQGYPGAYRTGDVIRGLEAFQEQDQIKLFHAGTGRNARNETIAQGGRVLTLAALQPDLGEARRVIYQAIARIDWPGGYYRKDIGWRALGKTNE